MSRFKFEERELFDMEHGTQEYRIEHDSMGEVKVPADKYWAAQTERSHENFRIGVGIETMPRDITHAFGILKKAAAQAVLLRRQSRKRFPMPLWRVGLKRRRNTPLPMCPA